MVVPNLTPARGEKVREQANAFRKFICEIKRIRWMANINYKSIHIMVVLWSKPSCFFFWNKNKAVSEAKNWTDQEPNIFDKNSLIK